MKIAVLAVQGAFAEQEQMLEQLGTDYVELRKKQDLELDFDGLILPGGESTVQGRLLRELDMYDSLKQRILEGLPVLGTCAGLILLAQRLENDNRQHLATLPVTVKRNAYGRQLGSFHTRERMEGIGEFPMTFIRAPLIESVGKGVRVLARVEGQIVAVRYQNQLALAFHPELDNHLGIHQYFLDMAGK